MPEINHISSKNTTIRTDADASLYGWCFVYINSCVQWLRCVLISPEALRSYIAF